MNNISGLLSSYAAYNSSEVKTTETGCDLNFGYSFYSTCASGPLSMISSVMFFKMPINNPVG